MICSNCGKRLKSDATVCDLCGKTVEKESVREDSLEHWLYTPEPEEEPIPAEEDLPSEESQAEELPRRSQKLWILAAAIGVLAVVAVIFGFAFGQKPPQGSQGGQTTLGTNQEGPTPTTRPENIIWLVTSHKTVSSIGDTEEEIFEYTEDGKIASYNYLQKSQLMSSLASSSRYSADYLYDDLGRLETVVLKTGESWGTLQLQCTYSYNGALVSALQVENLTAPTPSNSFTKWVTEFGLDGKLQSATKQRNGAEDLQYTFVYREDGTLFKQIRKTLNTRLEVRYDGAGYAVEQSYKQNGTEHFLVQNYRDENGRMVQQSHYLKDNVWAMTRNFQYTYENGRLKQLLISEYQPGEQENQCLETSLNFTAQWDGNICVLTTEDVIADPTLLEMYQGATITFEMDEAGNCLWYQHKQGQKLIREEHWEYVAMVLPEDYEMPKICDPKYLLFMVSS